MELKNSSNVMDNRMSIVALTWPIFLEVLLRSLLNTSDVFMLSHYSDKAVSAVGVIGQISFLLIIISMMISTASSILIAQYNGASRHDDATKIGVASVYLGIVFGLTLGLISFFCADLVTQLFGLEPDVAKFGYDYLIITGSLTISVTLGLIFSTILRSHGYSRSPMLVNLLTGIINIFGNYCALYQPFGLPVYGVEGVAIATVFSQFVSALILWFLIAHKKIDLPMRQCFSIPMRFYKKILSIGVMNAGEVLSYNLAQMMIVYFVVQMGTASLTAFTYAQNIARLSFAFSLSLGQASQIQTSYFVGKGWIASILIRVQKYFVVGLIVSTLITSIVYLFRYDIINLFTTDPEVMALTAGLMAGSILLEMGRVFNLVFISSLKGAGDIVFPVKMGIASMWGVSVVLAYLLGIHFAFGVIGAWLAIAADEWLRGIIMLFRWRSKKWVKFAER
ncbi:MATE family efflux transporter [Psychromonas marina]|uniref:MATE family efflux transporter n=1 Tax=Psychromonas marina TaxID=88364 RepID=A0ABQ6DZY1_9GAMM|nr:MATE family efflux transporter [Psychromonas marina]GLS90723.1 MATE family efflux transporter [Psychromonas marina]